MKIRHLFLISLFSMFILEFGVAKNVDNNNSNGDKLFSLDGKVYTQNDFPKDYQKLSKKKQEKFIRKFLYYQIFLKSIKDEPEKI